MRVLTSAGKQHDKFSDMKQFLNAIVVRSQGILCTQEPATTVLTTFPYALMSQDPDYLAGPPWPHTHTLDVSRDEVFLRIGERAPFLIECVTVMGQLQWIKRRMKQQFFILEKVPDCAVFAGAAIADYGVEDGRMCAFIFPDKGRTMGVHRFQLTEKQKNIIRNLKIKCASDSPPLPPS